MNLISRDLQSVVKDGYRGNAMLKPYIKRRIFSIIFLVVVLLILVTTSVFTDLGLNIGEAILRVASKLLGF